MKLFLKLSKEWNHKSFLENNEVLVGNYLRLQIENWTNFVPFNQES